MSFIIDQKHSQKHKSLKRKACAETAGDRFRTFQDDALSKYCICYGIVMIFWSKKEIVFLTNEKT
jgi:hypothetical protein